MSEQRIIVPPAQGDTAALDRANVTPASLAALAEAGVIFLPLQELVREFTYASGGPLVAWPVFAVLFVGGVGVATAWRRSRRTTGMVIGAAVAIAIVQTAGWGSRNPFAGAAVVLLSLAATLRVVTLAARDWREPIGASMFGGAVALLLEVAIGSSDAPEPWPALIGPIVVLFFVASLASRAASVRIEEAGRPPAPLATELRNPGTIAGMALVPLLAVSVMLSFVAAGAGQGGALDRFGRAVAVVMGGILTVVAWVLSPLAIAIAWVVRLVHLDLFGLVRRLSTRFHPAGESRPTTHGSVIERILQVAVFLAVAWLLIWLIRRRRRLALGPIARRRVPDPGMVGSLSTAPVERERKLFRIRRELPEVTVRRWYAEALLALERREMPKPHHMTPAEFVFPVGAAFPSVRPSFEGLTRAYEDVRYGDREVTHERLDRLRDRRALLLETFRTAPRADVEPVEEVEPVVDR